MKHGEGIVSRLALATVRSPNHKLMEAHMNKMDVSENVVIIS